MALLRREQLKRIYNSAPQVSINFTTTAGATNDVTSILTSLSTADGVPLQVAVTTSGSESMGYILSTRFKIQDTNSKQAMEDGSGNEIYVKLTKPASVYLANYFSLVGGVETAYTMSAGSNVDFVGIPYLYNDLLLPYDALTRANAVVVGEDPKGSGKNFIETITATATNTLSDLTNDPVPNTPIALNINGGNYYATIDFTVASKAITWLNTQSSGGFDILTSDTVRAIYTKY